MCSGTFQMKKKNNMGAIMPTVNQINFILCTCTIIGAHNSDGFDDTSIYLFHKYVAEIGNITAMIL